MGDYLFTLTILAIAISIWLMETIDRLGCSALLARSVACLRFVRLREVIMLETVFTLALRQHFQPRLILVSRPALYSHLKKYVAVQGALAACLIDGQCVENLVCLQKCNGRPDEAGCQVCQTARPHLASQLTYRSALTSCH